MFVFVFFVVDCDVDFGVMIFVLYNVVFDNGIKIFVCGGCKLFDVVEQCIEEVMNGEMLCFIGVGVGCIDCFFDVEDCYVVYLFGLLLNCFEGIYVVFDCVYGVVFGVLFEMFCDVGVEVIVIGVDFDGWNINDGVGLIYFDNFVEVVVCLGVDIGIVYDGDVDCCFVVDVQGNVIDGDQIMVIFVVLMKECGCFMDDIFVVIVMSNFGLYVVMCEYGIIVWQIVVGDCYVFEDMNEGGYVLGGEQFGYVIMSEYVIMGDGIFIGLYLVVEMVWQNKLIVELVLIMIVYLQVFINVCDVDKDCVLDDEVVQQVVCDIEIEFGDIGCVLLCKFGMELLVCVMVEVVDVELVYVYVGCFVEVVQEWFLF